MSSAPDPNPDVTTAEEDGEDMPRLPILDADRLKVWVRAGGHCTICHAYLLESEITFRYVRLGELAHIVGAKNSDKAPRGLSGLTAEQRRLAENLLLACGTCHTDIDDRAQAGILDVAWLLRVKEDHERRIRQATSLADREETSIFRLVGSIRGASVEIGGIDAHTAVNVLADRRPYMRFDQHRGGPEIDLRALPNEDDPIAGGYYEQARARIDQIIRERLRPAVERAEVKHLSVFGFARIPLLVYFGSRLDDTISTDIFQRHRATESWNWDDAQPPVNFEFIDDAPDLEPGSTDAVLLVNASGTIDPTAIPTDLAGLPTFTIAPVDAVPNRDIIRSRAARDSFHDALNGLLGHIEARHKPVTRLHVLAAAPTSAAIILGRSVGWGFHPSLLVYDRVGDEYHLAMEVHAP